MTEKSVNEIIKMTMESDAVLAEKYCAYVGGLTGVEALKSFAGVLRRTISEVKC